MYFQLHIFQVYASCNFCGKSLAKYTNGLPEMFNPKNSNETEMKKIAATITSNNLQKHIHRFQACSQCRRPMPRCAVCLLNLGSHAGKEFEK